MPEYTITLKEDGDVKYVKLTDSNPPQSSTHNYDNIHDMLLFKVAIKMRCLRDDFYNSYSNEPGIYYLITDLLFKARLKYKMLKSQLSLSKLDLLESTNEEYRVKECFRVAKIIRTNTVKINQARQERNQVPLTLTLILTPTLNLNLTQTLTLTLTENRCPPPSPMKICCFRWWIIHLLGEVQTRIRSLCET